jgi:hypothetical protein
LSARREAGIDFERVALAEPAGAPRRGRPIGLDMSPVSTENRQFVISDVDINFISDVNINCALSPSVSTFALPFFHGSQYAGMYTSDACRFVRFTTKTKLLPSILELTARRKSSPARSAARLRYRPGRL